MGKVYILVDLHHTVKFGVTMEELMTGSDFQPLAYRQGSFYLLVFSFHFC